MSNHTLTKFEPAAGTLTDDTNDNVWGCEAIGKEIDRTAAQVRYMYEKGLLSGAVTKVSHKLFLGSKSRLKQLARTKVREAPVE
jgi:hypothetical protein